MKHFMSLPMGSLIGSPAMRMNLATESELFWNAIQSPSFENTIV